MKLIRPIILIVTGLVVTILGFFYDGVFAGIPYQDPTPELAANYAFHSRIASVIELTGFLLFLFGCLVAIYLLVVRLRSRWLA